MITKDTVIGEVLDNAKNPEAVANPTSRKVWNALSTLPLLTYGNHRGSSTRTRIRCRCTHQSTRKSRQISIIN